MNTIYFDDINSYYDLNLILNPFEIPPAEPKTNYLEIPGADGDIDLTEALGEVKYKSRFASAVFSVLPSDDWEQKKSEVSNLLNGQRFNITKSSDPDWYFEGRCTVVDYKCDKFNRTITVDMHLKPYKVKKEMTVVSCDSESQTINLYNYGKPVVPQIQLISSATIEFDGNSWELNRGDYTLPEFVLKTGNNEVYVDTIGQCIFSYQERSL